MRTEKHIDYQPNAPDRTMPQNIIIFERIAYGAVAISGLSLISLRLELGAAAIDLVPSVTLVSIFWAALIWLTARGRRNWARFLYGAFAVLGATKTVSSFVFIALSPKAFPEFGWPSELLILLTTALQIIATYFLFSGSAATWFQRPR